VKEFSTREQQMSAANKMICPDCGAGMNHHAMKIDYGNDDQAIVDPIFGGVLNEVHACPECGKTELRNA
jgi:predicted RNA-binding Zn-ribbon protein involved in translation (DUF1610 family)